MRKSLIILINLSIILLAVNVYSQNLDSLMTRKYISCQDIYLNSSYLVTDYYAKDKTDSLSLVLDYIENRCGKDKLINKYRFLTEIKSGNFNSSLINKSFFNELVMISKMRHYYYFPGYSYYHYQIDEDPYLMFHQSMNDITDTIANSILENNKTTATENFIVNFYNDNTSLNELKTNTNIDSTLRNYYTDFSDSIKRIPQISAKVYTGIFLPNESAKVLGSHLIFGFGFGTVFYKNTIDIQLEGKFGLDVNDYTVMYNDTITSTDKSSIASFGIEYGRTVFIKDKSEYYLSAGLGAQILTAIASDEEINKKSKTLWSPEITFGVGYRYRYNYSNFLSLQLLWEYVNFSNPDATQLKGNCINIRLSWNFTSNQTNKLLTY